MYIYIYDICIFVCLFFGGRDDNSKTLVSEKNGAQIGIVLQPKSQNGSKWIFEPERGQFMKRPLNFRQI